MLDVMYSECIFGRAPFASRSLKEVVDKIKDPKPIEVRSDPVLLSSTYGTVKFYVSYIV